MELTIRPKHRYNGKKERDTQVVTQETWQNMINNGLADRFVIVSQHTAPIDDDKIQRIKELTQEINQQAQPDFQKLLAEYRKTKKHDKDKAHAILKQLAEMSPANKYVNNELKLYEND